MPPTHAVNRSQSTFTFCNAIYIFLSQEIYCQPIVRSLAITFVALFFDYLGAILLFWELGGF